jgi:hypothetical protein
MLTILSSTTNIVGIEEQEHDTLRLPDIYDHINGLLANNIYKLLIGDSLSLINDGDISELSIKLSLVSS